MLFRYMLKELRNGPRFALLFTLNLSLGLLGFISLDALKRTFDDRLQDSAKTLLGGDIAISSRRPIGEAEERAALAKLPPGTEAQQTTSLYTMAVARDLSSLVEVRAIDDRYPFYGDILLDKHGPHRKAPPLSGEPSAWIAPELAIKLGVKAGEAIRIGEESFTVADTIKDDTANSIAAAMAPRIYLSSRFLAATGLMKAGNTASYTILYRLPGGSSVKDQLTLVKQGVPDPSVRVRSYQEAGQDNGRMLAYLSDYLGLVALVAFALAGIGSAYLYRDYFERRGTSIAVMISLGLTHNKTLLLYLLQVCFLGTISAAISSLLALGLIPFLLRMMQDFSPVAIAADFPWQSLVVALLLGTFGSVFVCLPILQKLRRLKPSILFQEQSLDPRSLKVSDWLAYLPMIAAFYSLSVWQAHSVRIGSVFFGLSLLVLLSFGAMGWLFLLVARSLRRSRALPLRLASLFLRSHPASTVSAFIAIGLGSTLINLIPQLQGSLMRELERPAGQSLPSFFLFDIQDDQVPELQSLLTRLGSTPQTTSPMIMARLVEVNGAAFSRSKDEKLETRESEQEENSRNRGVNLSYRSELARGETVLSGRFFTGPFKGEGLGEVSLESNYAGRLNLKLGDIMKFDVQGLEIEAKVTSLRQVRWNTFEPNFFIVLQPGVIDDAPKTFLMNIPTIPVDQKVQTQLAIVRAFPNISVIDVTALVARISLIVSQMATILNVMAYLTTFTGMLVIFSIAQHQALARRWDHNLLKILGAEFPVLIKATALEFLGIAGFASCIGAGIGLLTSLIIAKVMFKGVWHVQILIPIAISAALIFICLATAAVATLRILRSRPELQIET